eukprot:CAMPEP_0170442132 /NCGR_PEP_ID=MMETSP0117_2-20130122/47256_1 /TAXON_ID=400756 /ORGANISM="Durinskia baltica, Strain CSIRO CS-38" /LENGTH=158 /DNA_ID=CAMNT_0010702703 /DNA_START=1 /DNA_END=474 /DNA_ORIENTATION=-
MLSSLLSLSGVMNGSGKSITIRAYDLEEVKKLSSAMLFELLAATYMYFIRKSTAQLLMIPLMGITGKLKSPIVQIHLFRMQPVGPLERPFKSGFQLMLEGLGGSTTKSVTASPPPATATATVAMKESEKRKVQAAPVREKRLEKALDTGNKPGKVAKQ